MSEPLIFYKNLDREARANAIRAAGVAVVVATVVVDKPEGSGVANIR